MALRPTEGDEACLVGQGHALRRPPRPTLRSRGLHAGRGPAPHASSTECPWACGPPMVMKMDSSGSTMIIAGDGRGRNRSGDVEAATEFDPGRVC